MIQRTVASTDWIEGIGVHTGQSTRCRFRPAPVNSGIVFLSKGVRIPLNLQSVINTPLCTSICYNSATVMTVEHLLAAFYGLGISNAFVDVDGPEIPILDGSSSLFVKHIQPVQQRLPVVYAPLYETVKVVHNDSWAEFRPDDYSTWEVTVEFPHPIGKQTAFYNNKDDWFSAVSIARTFGFSADKEKLNQQGLALGASEKTGIIVTDKLPALRLPNEFAVHKLLDAQGDLMLAGVALKGHYRAYKPGHALNQLLVQEILSQINTIAEKRYNQR